MTATVTLTTDFGSQDEYVGVMKGVIISRCPTVRLIDLCHGIRPQDVRQAALILASSYRFFPPGTIHVVVVDPGVGSSRRIILLNSRQHLFLLPDNGIATLLPPLDHAWEVTAGHLFLSPLSTTFHGRDIFAPVAAALAGGLPPSDVGLAIHPATLIRLHLPAPRLERNRLLGLVIDIDRFGNMTTSIHRRAAEQFCGKELHRLCVHIGAWTIRGISPSYASVASGEPVALFGSRDYLEIGINQGNCAAMLQETLDSPLFLSIQ